MPLDACSHMDLIIYRSSELKISSFLFSKENQFGVGIPKDLSLLLAISLLDVENNASVFEPVYGMKILSKRFGAICIKWPCPFTDSTRLKTISGLILSNSAIIELKSSETPKNLRFTKGNENAQEGFSGENERQSVSCPISERIFEIDLHCIITSFSSSPAPS